MKGTLEATRTMDEMNMNLKDEIIETQNNDPFLVEQTHRIIKGRQSNFELGEEIFIIILRKNMCARYFRDKKDNIERNTPNTLFHTPIKYKNVYVFERSVLVE
jgi:hypothetical protein